MLLDLTVNGRRYAEKNEKKVVLGDLDTHFDVMNKEFPLELTKRDAIVFDVALGRDIQVTDISISDIEKDMFVMFRTGFIEKEQYGTNNYFVDHPQLSDELIDCLLDKGVSIIGIDCAGIRRGKEHRSKVQYCADKGIFVIENLCNLNIIVQNYGDKKKFVVNTYPINIEGMTGLLCRVVAELEW